jgi:hypothetical protein
MQLVDCTNIGKSHRNQASFSYTKLRMILFKMGPIWTAYKSPVGCVLWQIYRTISSHSVQFARIIPNPLTAVDYLLPFLHYDSFCEQLSPPFASSPDLWSGFLGWLNHRIKKGSTSKPSDHIVRSDGFFLPFAVGLQLTA